MKGYGIAWQFGSEESEFTSWGWTVVYNLRREPEPALPPRLMCFECHVGGLTVFSFIGH